MAFLVSFVSEMKIIEFWNWNQVFSEFHENLRKRFWKNHFACLRIFRTKKVLFDQNWLCSCSTCPFFFFRRYWRDRCFFLIDIECWAIANTKTTFFLRFFWKENKNPWLGALSGVKYWQRKKSTWYSTIPRNLSPKNWKIPRISAENVEFFQRIPTFSAEFCGIFQFLEERFREITRNLSIFLNLFLQNF